MRGAAIVFGCVLLMGCGTEEMRGQLCTVGMQQGCTCPDGVTTGMRTCQTDGTYAAACTGCGMPAPPVDGNQLSQYVVTKLTLPENAMVMAYDLDGDGTADNRLGSINGAISALDLGPQKSTDSAIKNGTLAILLEQLSTDVMQLSAKNAGVRITRGLASLAAPKFDGSDVFTVDPADAPDQLVGDIVSGVFTSQDPKGSLLPVELVLGIPLIEGEPPVPLPITAARLTFTRGANGRISGGQLNGAIRKTDVDALVLPAVAKLITIDLQSSSMLAGFDLDKNGTVTAMELADHALIQGLLAPDVSIFGGGTFNPDPHAPEKDALSLGVSFEAVPASF